MTLKKAGVGTVLFSNLEKADSFFPRLIGLIKYPSLGEDQALWITRANSIHTFFMRFAIDCVFVDSKGQVKKIYHHVQPWRCTMPVWGARDVIEMAAGQARRKEIAEGDILECGL